MRQLARKDLIRRPPGFYSKNLDNSVYYAQNHLARLSTNGASALAAVDVLNAASSFPPPHGEQEAAQNVALSFMLFRFFGDGFVAFGNSSNVLATNLDFAVYAGEVWEWSLFRFDRYMSLLRAGSTDLVVQFYRTDAVNDADG